MAWEVDGRAQALVGPGMAMSLLTLKNRLLSCLNMYYFSLCNDVMMCNNNNISCDSEYHMVSEDSLPRPMFFV